MAKKATEQKKKAAKKSTEVAEVLSSGGGLPRVTLFRVTRDRIVEPGAARARARWCAITEAW